MNKLKIAVLLILSLAALSAALVLLGLLVAICWKLILFGYGIVN